MTDYIKREDALKAVCGGCGFRLDNKMCNAIKGAIKSMPAADAEEVRHGYYQGEADGYADGAPVYDMWYCSECGHYFEECDEKPTYNYCPYCGAKMDE